MPCHNPLLFRIHYYARHIGSQKLFFEDAKIQRSLNGSHILDVVIELEIGENTRQNPEKMNCPILDLT